MIFTGVGGGAITLLNSTVAKTIAFTTDLPSISVSSDILYANYNAGIITFGATTATTAGKFNSSSIAPVGATRLNYEGHLYATQLYDGGERVSVVGHAHPYSLVVVNGTTYANSTATFYAPATTAGIANALLLGSTNGAPLWSTVAVGSMAYASTSSYQPIDADLTAIAALSGTVGLLKKTAANTWTLDTAAYTTSSGVTSVSLASGTNNGTLKLTVNGSTTDNIAVKGLGSMAYVANTGTTAITTLGTIATGTWSATAIGATYGGTGQTAVALGDILYGSAANAWSRLAANTTTTAKYLRSISSGTPTWGQIDYSEISGMPGTYTPSTHSITSHTASAWKIFYTNATTTAIQELTLGAAGTFLGGNSTMSSPSWKTFANLTVSTGLSLDSGSTYSPIAARTISLTSLTSGSATVGALRYNGTTLLTGALYGGTSVPSSTTARLNYDGWLYATQFEGIVDGGNWD